MILLDCRPINDGGLKDTIEAVGLVDAHNSRWVCVCEGDLFYQMKLKRITMEWNNCPAVPAAVGSPRDGR